MLNSSQENTNTMKTIRPYSDSEKITLRRTSKDVKEIQFRIYSVNGSTETSLFELFVESLSDLPDALKEKIKEIEP